MPATISEISPGRGERGKSSAEERASLPDIVNSRIQECLAEAGGWISEARLSQRYYRSDQYRKNSKDRHRIRLVANFIRRDIDLVVAELLDGEPVVNPSGRNPRHFELGRLLLQVLQWTRDEEDDWDQDLELAIVDCVHIGEGVIFEGWNQDADKGSGLPVAKRLDSRYVFWDPAATQMQRDDADYVIWLEYKSIEQIDDMWPHLRGQIQPETAETFLSPSQQSHYRSTLGSAAYMPLLGMQRGLVRRAWIRRQWSKKHKFRYQYWNRDTWDAAVVVDPLTDEEHRMDDADYARLSPEDKEAIYQARVPYTELWETVTINKTLVDHRLSPFDESNGGHGRYPFAFFPCNILADESHARGEIGFLIQVQDIANEAISQGLNQLFLQNVGYLHSYTGSVNPEDEDKIPMIGRDPTLHIRSIPGMPPPSFQGANPTGMQSSISAIGFIKDVIMDSVSGIHRVDRGQVEGGVQSGRAIRALQARTSLLSNKLVRHIESGLKRGTLLRLHNIMQFMRGNRILQVADPDRERGEKTLIIGHDEVEMVSYHNLKVEQDEDNSVKFLFPDGSEAELLVLNDEVSRDVIYEQIRLKLDTGQEKNKLERQEDARMVLEAVGPPAVPWVARQLEWADPEMLLDEIKKSSMGAQILEQLQDLEKQSGIAIPDIMAKVAQMIQQEMMMAEVGAPPAGTPAPPGMEGTPAPPEMAGPPVGPETTGPALPPGMAAPTQPQAGPMFKGRPMAPPVPA